MTKGRQVRVKVRTVNATFEGSLTIPPMRKRVSDVLNEESKTFINLTDVHIDGTQELVPFVSINKDMIVSIIE